MNKLDMAKRIIRAHFDSGCCGLYDTRNIVGDSMETIYDNEGLRIELCTNWSYFEVFGLSKAEFLELKKFYESIHDMRRR